jgi:hypothetical protein
MAGSSSRSWALYGLLFLLLAANMALWQHMRGVKAQWMNVPPTPSFASAKAFGLGDTQFAYRVFGVMIQNFGDTGGRVTPIKDYDFEALGRWFNLQHALDPKSDHMPFLAAFVFGGSQDPQKLGPVIAYLEKAAGDGAGQKWRWLAHAINISRFKMQDMPTALRLAEKMAAFKNPDMPLWTRQMRGFIMNDRGDKQAALEVMLSILQSGHGVLQQGEVNATLDYICSRILSPQEAETNSLCVPTP